MTVSVFLVMFLPDCFHRPTVAAVEDAKNALGAGDWGRFVLLDGEKLLVLIGHQDSIQIQQGQEPVLQAGHPRDVARRDTLHQFRRRLDHGRLDPVHLLHAVDQEAHRLVG